MYNLTRKEIEITLDTETVKDIKRIVKFHKIFGILGIAVGIFYAITIIGAIVGVPIIMIALNFKKAGKFLNDALTNEDKEDLGNYFIYQKKSMKIYFVSILIGIVFAILILISTILIGIVASLFYR